MGKDAYPARLFEVACSNRGRVICVHGGFPGSFNDKAAATSSPMFGMLRSHPLLTEAVYEVLDASGGRHARKGAWVLVDGGYTDSKLSLHPLKSLASAAVGMMSFSEMAEAARKSIECVFGKVRNGDVSPSTLFSSLPHTQLPSSIPTCHPLNLT